MSELVLDLFENDSDPVFISGQGTLGCTFGIAPALDTPIQLGASFMRSAYVVFDIDNNEISLAQTNFDANGTNVLEIGKEKSLFQMRRQL
jgi:hypothetical protein